MVVDTVNGTVYLGGSFSQVGGVARLGVAAIEAGTGAVLPFACDANGMVHALALSGDTLFVGGEFTSLGDSLRERLASVDKHTGLPHAWAPSVNNIVHTIAPSPGLVHVGGTFEQVNGSPRSRLAVLERGSGALTPWTAVMNGPVRAILLQGDTLLAAGAFTTANGVARGRMALFDRTTAALLPWNADADGAITSMELDGELLLCGGTFTTIAGAARARAAVVDLASGSPTAWSPTIAGGVQTVRINGDHWLLGGFMTTVEGFSNQHFAAYHRSTGEFDTTSVDPASTVYALAEYDGRLHMGGVFSSVGSTLTGSAPAFDLCSPSRWYADGDGDGFGAPGSWVWACTAPPGHVANDLDCDDDDDTIFPLAVCDDGDPYTTDDQWGATCDCQGTSLLVGLKVILDGAYDPGTGLMRDHLRQQGLLPLTEPYTAAGYSFASSTVMGGETLDPALLLVEGPDAIVDWVIVELRDRDERTDPVATRCALVTRSGAVVDVDGSPWVRFPATIAPYHLAVTHRNHMGVVLELPADLHLTVQDFRLDSTVCAYSGSRKTVGALRTLHAGDCSFNDEVKYAGSGNDRDRILLLVGGTVPTNMVTGYHPEDCNMDGVVKYAGSGNDRDIILLTVGGLVPTAIRTHYFDRPTN